MPGCVYGRSRLGSPVEWWGYPASTAKNHFLDFVERALCQHQFKSDWEVTGGLAFLKSKMAADTPKIQVLAVF